MSTFILSPPPSPPNTNNSYLNLFKVEKIIIFRTVCELALHEKPGLADAKWLIEANERAIHSASDFCAFLREYVQHKRSTGQPL